LVALKLALTPGQTPSNMSACGRVIVLHGLLSAAFDMQWRDQASLGINQPDPGSRPWRETISSAFNVWKACLDAALATATGPSAYILRSAIPIYAVCQVTLAIDVHELQIYAGAKMTLGLPVSDLTKDTTRNKVQRWANTPDGQTAAWHAAHFLKSSLALAENIPRRPPLSLYHIWAEYISILCVYAYCSSVGTPPDPGESVLDAQAFLDLMCTPAPAGIATVPVKGHYAGVIKAVYEMLSPSPWEIAQEAAQMLAGLLRIR